LRTPARPRLRRLASKAIAGTAAVACLFSGAAAYADPKGIDVSKWQHGTSIDWAKVKADGVTFTFIKATEGSGYTNDYLRSDWAAAERRGIYRGAYHFARPSHGSAARQARYFVRQAGKHADRGDLPPVLDLESDGGLSVSALRTWTKTWLRTTEELTGRKPIIYASPSFWTYEMGNSGAFRSYPLWVAHYTTGGPTVPGGWARWTFWQKSQTGRINGISGAVDINKFNGTRARLARLAQAGTSGDTGGDTGGDAGTGTTPGTGTNPGDPDTGTTPGTETPTAPEPAKTTTAVSLSLSKDTVYPGQSVEFAGRLRTTSGQALAGRRVALYRRADGSTTWTRIAAPTTSTTGRYAVTFAASASASFRVEYRGAVRYAESASRRAGLTVRPRTRTTSTLSVDHSAQRGRSVKVYGHLRTAAGRPVVGRTMHILERPAGSTRWRLVTRSVTLSPTGWYQAYVTASRTSTYRAVYRGGVAFTRAVSNLTTVRTR
jgi:GH25 family lysozyme M1 (1,4-beta-N-acetylmuramidase)